MKGKGGRILLLAALLLVCVQLLAPGWAGQLRSELLQRLGYRQGRYVEALDTLGTLGEVVRTEEVSAEEAPALLRIEEASVTGERAQEETQAEEPPEEPAAVAAFLESQLPFRDYALPETVDYAYEPLPFDYALPVSGYRSSGFGFRLHPLQNVVKFHYGTDIAANSGEDVHAFADGIVLTAAWDGGYGNYLVVDHGGGWRSLYAHLSWQGVAAEERVTRGQVIARVGATGQVTGPHLHFELQHNGIYRNPEYYING